jgi:hypothetical protein
MHYAMQNKESNPNTAFPGYIDKLLKSPNGTNEIRSIRLSGIGLVAPEKIEEERGIIIILCTTPIGRSCRE